MTYDETVAAGVGWDTVDVARTWQTFPALDGDTRADVCVVGLGGSGLAAVEEARRRGLDVIGIDMGRVARGAAGRNGGILAPGSAMSLATDTPGVEFADKIRLYHRTRDELVHLAETLGRDVVQQAAVTRISGFVRGPRDDAERALEADHHAAALAELEAMHAARLPVHEYVGEWGRGLVFPECGRINPASRALGLAQILAERGARLHEFTRVEGFAPGEVHTSGGVVRAEHVVVAVDGKLDALLPQLAPAVTTYRLQMLATAPLGRRILDGPLSARDDFEWMQQDEAGRLLIGGGRDRHVDAERTLDDDPTADVQAWIEEQATRAVGGPVNVTHRWAASVGYTTDGRALCIPMGDGLVACGGYSGAGNLVGPVAARAAVAHLVDAEAIPAYLRSEI